MWKDRMIWQAMIWLILPDLYWMLLRLVVLRTQNFKIEHFSILLRWCRCGWKKKLRNTHTGHILEYFVGYIRKCVHCTSLLSKCVLSTVIHIYYINCFSKQNERYMYKHETHIRTKYEFYFSFVILWSGNSNNTFQFYIFALN